jgi:hypothetical protein
VRSASKLRTFALCVAFASVVASQAMLIGYKTYANVDEGYACALASRLLDGQKLYQGAISQRGPLMYYAFEAFAAVFGWHNVVALRLVALALALMHVGVVYWAGRKLLSEYAAIVATLITAYELSFGFPPEDGIAINGETLQLPLLVVAAVLGAIAMRSAPRSRPRTKGLVAAGLLLGIATAIKQSVALHPIAIVVWLVVDAHRRRLSWRTPFVETAILGASVLAVPLLFVIHAAEQGTLRDLYYYVVVYNRDVHMHPTPRHFRWLTWLFFRLTDQTTFPMITALLAGRAAVWIAARVRAVRRLHDWGALGRGFGVRHYLALHFAIAFASATMMYRFFPHYYMQSAPFFSLCIAAMVERLFTHERSVRTARALAYAFGIFTAVSAGIGCDFAERADGEVSHDETVKTIARVIRATTKPDDRIFVWGFSPWIYGYAERKPAGRYVFETYVTGFVPWFWEKLDYEASRIVPGSQEALLGDLLREDPVVVVDAGSVMMARPMREYRLFADFLHARYCFDMRIGAFDLYRRRPQDGRCPTTESFPRVADACDFRGHLMSVPIPRTVDLAEARRLPRGSFFKPLYFLDGGKPVGLEAAVSPRREKDEAEGAAEGFYVEEVEP